MHATMDSHMTIDIRAGKWIEKYWKVHQKVDQILLRQRCSILCNFSHPMPIKSAMQPPS